jgi:hypothetical protein
LLIGWGLGCGRTLAVCEALFPVVYARDVAAAVAFCARLGFEEVYRFPPEGEAGFSA